MRLTIAPVAASDDEAIQAWCDVFRLSNENDLPNWRTVTPGIVRGWLGEQLPGFFTEGYTASVTGQPIGTVRLTGYTQENLDTLEIDIHVVPQARRLGFGRQLHDFSVQRAADLKRTKLLTMTAWELPGVPGADLCGARFAKAFGYSEALTDVVRRLDVSNLDDEALETMLAEARAKSLGYRLIQWSRELPEPYLADLAHLETRLFTDAPQGELKIEPPKPEPERMRRYQEAMLKRGRVPFNTAAIHEATDRLVAWTTVTQDPGLDWNAFQQVTVVDPDHRGHRLGALIKVENLRFTLQQMPVLTSIDTFNADANSYMISINERMGFRPLYAFQNWQREI